MLARLLLFVAALCLSLGAAAQVNTPGKQVPSISGYCYNVVVGQWTNGDQCASSASAAADEALAWLNARVGSDGSRTTWTVVSIPDLSKVNSATGQFSFVFCYANGSCENPSSTGGSFGKRAAPASCPANSQTAADGSCWCSADFVASNGACVPSGSCAAKAGTSEQRNFTIGWSRTSGAEQESAWDASVLQRGADMIGSSVCDGSCVGTISANNQSNAWQGTQPNGQGLYRLSVDYTFTFTGASCTASQKSSALDPSAPGPSCDGYLGQIGNKPACVGKPGSSDAKVTTPSPVLAGNPAAGSSPTDPGRTGGGGGAAGGPSSSSDGQIRGGSGSPTNGSGGTGSSATGDKEIKVEMCGSQGQPPCKIDESGTPDGKGAFSSADAALESASKSREAGIRDAGDRKALPWSPSGILLPTAGCEVQRTETRLGVMPLDLCNSPIAQLWRQLLGWLLYMLTLLYCWRVAGGSIGGGK